MNAFRPTIQRATLAAMRRGKATLAGPQQGVHNLSPQSAVPVSNNAIDLPFVSVFESNFSLTLALSLSPVYSHNYE